jgi:serine/threonine-protein kinase ATR
MLSSINAAFRSFFQAARKSQSNLIADDKPWFDYIAEAVLNYAKSVHRGPRHVHHALPRLLTLWFEFGSTFKGQALKKNPKVLTIFNKVRGLDSRCPSAVLEAT